LRLRLRSCRNFWVRILVRQFFKFENPTPVQTPASIIDPTVSYPCFYLRNDHTDSCCCRNWKVTLDPGPFFPKFFTPVPDPGPKETRRILPESTPALQILSHLFVIVAQSRTSNYSVLKEKVLHVCKQGEKLSENIRHSLSQPMNPTSQTYRFFPSTQFLRIFQRTIIRLFHFPTLTGENFRLDFHCLEIHIRIMTVK